MTSESSLTLTALGDLMFYGSIAEAIQEHNDPAWLFGNTLESLRSGDILFGNFETPVSAARQNEPDAPNKFYANPGTAGIVKNAGFDIVNLANNHIYDFGAEGVECTLRELEEVGLPAIGIGKTSDEAARPVIISARGLTVGFLGYTTAFNALEPSHQYVACFPEEERIANDIRKLKENVDIVVVSCHLGSQYNHYPAPETRKLAAHCMRSGALVFLGHHPHVSGGVEKIDQGLAVYSLGDFIAPIHTEACRRTYAIQIRLSPEKVFSHSLIPCFIQENGQTTLASGDIEEDIQMLFNDVTESIQAGESDRKHFEFASDNFTNRYISSWIREYRFGGFRFLWKKFRRFRYYHFQLLARILWGKMIGIFSRKNTKPKE